jgi:hypothetical protein
MVELAMQIEFEEGNIVVDATLIGKLLKIAPAEVPELMRTKAITSLCERGIDEHEGEYRLSFFYQNRRGRLSVDAAGTVLRRSAIDFGDVSLPRQLHRARKKPLQD